MSTTGTLITEALAACDIGRVKRRNEDAFLVDKKLQLFIVADGMGGHAAGEVASETAIDELQAYVDDNQAVVERFVSTGEGREAVLQMLEAGVRTAGRAIYARALAEPEKRGMGTTTSALLLTPTRGFIAHVGDSRVYMVRSGEVFQLTEDHSLINELIKRGRLKPEDAHRAPYRNAVTRAVGVHADVQVDTLDFELTNDDHFLLCSDGLTNHLRDKEEIREVLDTQAFLAAPKAFVELANARGGKDNITSLLVHAKTSQGATDTQVRVNALRKMPLFQHLSYVELTEVLNLSQLRTIAADAVIFDEGELGEALYVVLDGQVSIRKGDVELVRLGPGGHFGEMSIMDKGARSAAAVAVNETRLIMVERKPLFGLMREDKEVAVKLLWCFVQVLNQRLRTTNRNLEQARLEQTENDDLMRLGELVD